MWPDIRFDNLRGGNIPSHMFIGLIETSALNGDLTKSSTRFGHHGVSEMNITLNGNSVNGYPIKIKDAISMPVKDKFLDCTSRICSTEAGGMLTIDQFDFNYIFAHCFEVEQEGRGWIGVDFKLNTAFTTEMTMVAWIVSKTAVTVDKFHSVEKIAL